MRKTKYLLGYDIGSSSIKASIVDAEKGNALTSATSPKQEMKIFSPETGWAEQDPEVWWKHVINATHELLSNIDVSNEQIEAIGISYQMHGLVAVDKNKRVLRPSIIWCDSRAVDIGNQAFLEIGPEQCLSHMLNSPGNFTASKLKWVKDNEPQVFDQIYKIMLPGDYIAMKLTDQIYTSVSGLSEAILWDYQEGAVSRQVLDHYKISEDLIPDVLPSFSLQGELSSKAAEQLGLKKGTKIAYRAGDQPNNAFSLNVLNPGEAATTAGTSGVIYGVTDQPEYDKQSRVNTFVHVNHTPQMQRYGVLLCINGTGILNSWLNQNLGIDNSLSYDQMNKIASQSPIGSEGLTILPFGNGAERILENKDTGASIHGLNFNRHTTSHMLRAAQEGIVFSLFYGFQIMKDMELNINTVKAGNANMFLSPIFKDAFVNTMGSKLELYNTDGAQGAARGAGVGCGIFKTPEEAFAGLKKIENVEPDTTKRKQYLEAYENWLDTLNHTIKNDQ